MFHVFGAKAAVLTLAGVLACLIFSAQASADSWAAQTQAPTGITTSTAWLDYTGTCPANTTCQAKYQFQRSGATGWVTTQVAQTVTCGSSACTLGAGSWEIANLTPGTTYDFQVGISIDGGTYTFVGPDGTGSTTQAFATQANASWTAQTQPAVNVTDTTAGLDYSGGCPASTTCYAKYRYQHAGATGWVTTNVAQTVACGASSCALGPADWAIAGLSANTAYNFQVGISTDGTNYTFVGPDGTGSTVQSLTTAQASSGGTPPFPPCSDCTSTVAVASPSFTVDDGSGTGTNVTRTGVTLYAPAGLQADSTHKAAMVVLFGGGGGLTMWQQACQIKHCYVVNIPSDTQTGTAIYIGWTLVATTYLNTNAYWDQGCGPGGTYHCDSAPFWVAVINYMEAHYPIDPSWVFSAGGSKGNVAGWDMVCDTRTTNLIRGSAAISGGGTSGTNGYTVELPQHLNCPALGSYEQTGGPGEQTGVRHTGPLRVLSGYASTDGVSCGTTIPNKCTSGAVINGGWYYSSDQINTDLAAPHFACSTTPTTLYEGTGSIDRFHLYGSCTDPNTSFATVQVTGNYHTWEGLSGADPFGNQYPQPTCNCANNDTNLALQAWNFWTTGTP